MAEDGKADVEAPKDTHPKPKQRIRQQRRKVKHPRPVNLNQTQAHNRVHALTAQARMRMYSPPEDNSRQITNNFRKTGFFSNPHTPSMSKNRKKYFNSRVNRSLYNKPEVENSDFFPEVENNQTEKVKIRIQGHRNKAMWGNLNTSFPSTMKRSRRNRSDYSVRDAKRHAKLLARIEKYKEDKIIQELQEIEAEKAREARLLKIQKLKDQKRKIYFGKIFGFDL